MTSTPRCAICDADSQLATYCDFHDWLRALRQCVNDGSLSDWEHVNHGMVMVSQAIADDRAQLYDEMDARMGGMGLAQYVRLWAEMGVALDAVDATYDTSNHESPGDGLWREEGQIAHWIRDELARAIIERDKKRRAA